MDFCYPINLPAELKLSGSIFKISGQGVTDAPDQTKHVTLLTYWLLGLYKIGKKVLIKSESRGAIDQKVARSGTFPGNTSLKIRSTCAALTLVIIESHRQKMSDVFFQVNNVFPLNRPTAFNAGNIRGSKSLKRLPSLKIKVRFYLLIYHVEVIVKYLLIILV